MKQKMLVFFSLCVFFSLLLLRVELFPESNTQFLTETVEALEILLVLLLVLDLGLDTCWKQTKKDCMVSLL